MAEGHVATLDELLRCTCRPCLLDSSPTASATSYLRRTLHTTAANYSLKHCSRSDLSEHGDCGKGTDPEGSLYRIPTGDLSDNMTLATPVEIQIIAL